MDGERSRRALARIEDALARIEAAAGGPIGARSAQADDTRELAELSERHERLRSAVVQSLEQIDSMIEGHGIEGHGIEGHAA